jgi:hypothetical protein
VLGGLGQDAAIDLQRCDRADLMSQEGGVVADAGAYLQHAQPRLQVQVFEDLRHQRRLTRRADGTGRTRFAEARDESAVGVNQSEAAAVGGIEGNELPAILPLLKVVDAWQEAMPRRGSKGVDERARPEAALGDESIDHALVAAQGVAGHGRLRPWRAGGC